MLLEAFIEPDSISSVQLDKVSTYLELLLKWNTRINLTSVRSAPEIVTRHFGESFFAARNLTKNLSKSPSVIDIGSGAGFPGLPLKIWAPELRLTLVESNNKKVAFLREAIRSLDLDGCKVLAARAEMLSSKYDLVTLRAVERFDKTLLTAALLLKSQGLLGLLIGESQIAATKDLLPNLTWEDPIAIPLSSSRVLLLGQC